MLFAISKNDQKPFAEFPLLTCDGHNEVLFSTTAAMPDSVCLAWVARIRLAVYLLPPQDYRTYTEDAAFFVVCGHSNKSACVSNHGNVKFLYDLSSAILDCESGFLEKDEFDAVLTGIATEICVCKNFYDDIGPVLGRPWFFDKLEPEAGGEFAYCTESDAEDVAIVRAIFDGSRPGSVPTAYFTESGEFVPGDVYGFLGKDFSSSLTHALSDYRSRCAAYVAQAKKSKKPKRATRVRELLWNSYPHICGICGEQIDSLDEMHIDHIIPLSRGGKDILANLQLTHAKCNLEKGSVMLDSDAGEE